MQQRQTIAWPVPSALEVTLILTAFVAVNFGFGMYLFASLIAEMRVDLALGYQEVGLATGIAQIGFLTASLLSGLLAPRLGPAHLIFGAVAATTLSLLLMTRLPAAHPLLPLILLLTVMGVGAATVWVPMIAVTQALIPAHHRAKALGLISSGTSYGVFINGLIIPPLVENYGWRSVWGVVGLIAAILLAIGLWRLRGIGRIAALPAAASQENSGGFQGRRWIAGLLIATMCLNGLAFMPFQTYLVPLLQEDLGQPLSFATRIWVVIGFIGMGGGFLMGLLADRISIKWAMVLTYALLSGAAALLLALHWILFQPVLPFAAGILFSLAFYAIFGLVPAYISTLFSVRAATLLFGVGNIALGLGALIGNVSGGYLKDVFGSFAPIYGIILATAIAQIILALMTPNERRLNAAPRSSPSSDTSPRRGWAGSPATRA